MTSRRQFIGTILGAASAGLPATAAIVAATPEETACFGKPIELYALGRRTAADVGDAEIRFVGPWQVLSWEIAKRDGLLSKKLVVEMLGGESANMWVVKDSGRYSIFEMRSGA